MKCEICNKDLSPFQLNILNDEMKSHMHCVINNEKYLNIMINKNPSLKRKYDNASKINALRMELIEKFKKIPNSVLGLRKMKKVLGKLLTKKETYTK